MGKIPELEKQIEELTGKLSANTEKTPETDYKGIVSDIQSRLESGDIDQAEALSLMADASFKYADEQSSKRMEEVLQRADQSVKETLSAKDQEIADQKAAEMEAAYLEQNPDFATLQQDGTFDRILDENPMYKNDYVAANLHHKVGALETQNKALQDELSILKGTQNTSQTVTKAGDASQVENKNISRSKTQKDAAASMMAALDKAEL